MSIRTNQCLHCGKSREEHLTKEQISRLEYLESALMPHPIMLREIAELYKKEDHIFQDSGLSKLTEHQEELFEAVEKLSDELGKRYPDSTTIFLLNKQVKSIIQKIRQ